MRIPRFAILSLSAGLLIGGCGAVVEPSASPMVGVEIGTPIEYYFWDGQYHYWHDNQYVVVDHVPAGHECVNVDREPEHPLLRLENQEPGDHRDFNQRDEPER